MENGGNKPLTIAQHTRVGPGDFYQEFPKVSGTDPENMEGGGNEPPTIAQHTRVGPGDLYHDFPKWRFGFVIRLYQTRVPRFSPERISGIIWERSVLE